MDAHKKKILFNTIYYTLIGSMVALVVFFMITLTNASMAMWERVSYFVLAGLLALVVIYDIICTNMHKQKSISAWILYGLTLATFLLSMIVMAINSANGRLLLDISERFFRVILFSYFINILAILIFCTGEKLIVTISNRIKK